MEPGFDDSINKKTHHTIGLISFWTAIVTGAISFVLFIIAFIPESNTYTAERLNKIFFVFALIIAPILHIVGLALGIIGAFIKNSKKVFPALGIILNSLPLILAIIIWMFFLVIVLAVLGSGGGWM